jgi:hypothetical protein
MRAGTAYMGSAPSSVLPRENATHPDQRRARRGYLLFKRAGFPRQTPKLKKSRVQDCRAGSESQFHTNSGLGISCALADDHRLVLLLTKYAPLSSSVACSPSVRESKLVAQAAHNKTIGGARLCLNMFYSPQL